MIGINYNDRNKEIFVELKGSLAYSSSTSPYDPNLTLFSDEKGNVVGIKVIVNDDWDIVARHLTHNPSAFKIPTSLKQALFKFLNSGTRDNYHSFV